MRRVPTGDPIRRVLQDEKVAEDSNNIGHYTTTTVMKISELDEYSLGTPVKGLEKAKVMARYLDALPMSPQKSKCAIL